MRIASQPADLDHPRFPHLTSAIQILSRAATLFPLSRVSTYLEQSFRRDESPQRPQRDHTGYQSVASTYQIASSEAGQSSNIYCILGLP